MCGVFGAVMPGAEPTEAAAIATLGLFALQHRGQESAGVAVSDGEQLMLYKDLGMISTVLDERRLPSLRGNLAIAHCRYSTTGSTIWENAQPTYRQGPRRAIAIGHNGNLVNTRELLEQLQGGRARLPASTDTELLTALLADEPAADTVEALRPGPAPGPRRVQPGHPRPAAGHRRARPARLPAARPRPLPAVAAGRRRAGRRPVRAGRRAGLVPVVGDGQPRHRRRRGRPRRGAGRDRRPRAGSSRRARSATPRRTRPCACSSSSTSPAPTRTWRAATCTRSAAGWASSSPSSTRSRPTSSCPSRTPAPRPRPATPRPAACPTARACTATATPGGRSSSRRQGMRHRGVTIKLNPLREVVAGKRLIVVDDSIVRGHDDQAHRRAAAQGRRARGPRPDQRPAHLPPVLLRHRHVDRDRAHRVDPQPGADPRVHRRGLAGLPVHPGRAQRARPALRPVLLRLLRRQLPGARPVRRGLAQVHARRAGPGDPCRSGRG